MEHQFRRGIYRPKAQRLSISLAPLVAQRSLMFRVKTDLATKASYAELTPTEESPALYSFSESVQIISAVSTAMLTAMSTASVYSQDSWKEASPFVPVKVDPRRMAIAFSPSVQWWSDMAEGDSDKKIQVASPLVLSTSIPQPDLSFAEVEEDNNSTTHTEADVVLSAANDPAHESVKSFFDLGTPSPVGKRQTKINLKSRNLDEQTAKRPKSAFKKVMFMFQPPKRELAQLERADAGAVVVPNNLPSMDLDFKLPEFRLSPIFCPFLDQTPSVSQIPGTPSSMAPFDTLVEEDTARKGHRRCKSSPATPYFSGWDKDNMSPLPPMPAGPLKPTLSTRTIASRRPQTNIYPSVSRMLGIPSSMDRPVEEDGEDATSDRRLRATMPPHGISSRKGHRRYQSSPAVSYFRRWDKGNMPPLPPMPAGFLKAVAPSH